MVVERRMLNHGLPRRIARIAVVGLTEQRQKIELSGFFDELQMKILMQLHQKPSSIRELVWMFSLRYSEITTALHAIKRICREKHFPLPFEKQRIEGANDSRYSMKPAFSAIIDWPE